jgi:hypothetical protein
MSQQLGNKQIVCLRYEDGSKNSPMTVSVALAVVHFAIEFQSFKLPPKVSKCQYLGFSDHTRKSF